MDTYLIGLIAYFDAPSAAEKIAWIETMALLICRVRLIGLILLGWYIAYISC